MTLYLQPYMNTIWTVPMNLSDLIHVHSMFQLLYEYNGAIQRLYCVAFLQDSVIKATFFIKNTNYFPKIRKSDLHLLADNNKISGKSAPIKITSIAIGPKLWLVMIRIMNGKSRKSRKMSSLDLGQSLQRSPHLQIHSSGP